jgi:hypothetical protein
MLRRMKEASSPPSRGAIAFALLAAVLALALLFEVRETRVLRATLAKVTESKARERGLEEGRALEPLRLLDASGAEVAVRFDEAVGTVLLFHSSACGACEATAPRWRSALLEAARPDVRVVVAQTDGARARADLEGLPASLAVPLPPQGWLAGLPAVPATLVLDAEGVLVRAWYGELGDAEREALVETLARLAS